MVVADEVCLFVSVTLEGAKNQIWNPASIKSVGVEGVVKSTSLNMFQWGASMVNLLESCEILNRYKPRVIAFGSCIIDEMEFNTEDGFQGWELDVCRIGQLVVDFYLTDLVTGENKNTFSQQDSEVFDDIKGQHLDLNRNSSKMGLPKWSSDTFREQGPVLGVTLPSYENNDLVGQSSVSAERSFGQFCILTQRMNISPARTEHLVYVQMSVHGSWVENMEFVSWQKTISRGLIESLWNLTLASQRQDYEVDRHGMVSDIRGWCSKRGNMEPIRKGLSKAATGWEEVVTCKQQFLYFFFPP